MTQKACVVSEAAYERKHTRKQWPKKVLQESETKPTTKVICNHNEGISVRNGRYLYRIKGENSGKGCDQSEISENKDERNLTKDSKIREFLEEGCALGKTASFSDTFSLEMTKD